MTDSQPSARVTRRRLLRGAAAGIVAGLPLAYVLGGWRRALTTSSGRHGRGYGDLLRDPAGLLHLPAGFSYTAFSRAGETMSDGRRVPGQHDGMAAFPGRDGLTVLVRNHELNVGNLLDEVPAGKRFDPGQGDRQCLGGTTTLVYDTRKQRLISHHLSLAGTLRNCAGGATPWGSWISCEEAPYPAGSVAGCTVDHGWCFEVPASHPGLVDPIPLRDMGRFNHEAVAIHEGSGVVYLTEDRGDGLFYRFVPREPGRLNAGGRLQALSVVGRPQLDTSNAGYGERIDPGKPLPVEWLDLDGVHAPEDDLRVRGRGAGAATFVRGEGVIARGDEVFFMCTSGGATGRGQVWRYRASSSEGMPEEARARATLELFVEPNDEGLLDQGDNVSFSPNGDLVVCEDGGDGNRIMGITPGGEIYPLAYHAAGASEFAGCTPSADGSTLFVNIQSPGVTLAITGPWKRRLVQ